MKRRAFLAFLLVPILAGCGGGGGNDSSNNAAVFRQASPLTQSLPLGVQSVALAVGFQHLKAKVRGDVTIRLRAASDNSLVASADDGGDDNVIIVAPFQSTVALFTAPPVGSYYLEAVDSDGYVITKNESGDRVRVLITAGDEGGISVLVTSP